VADEVLQILKLRAELLEPGSAIRQLRNAGIDSAAAHGGRVAEAFGVLSAIRQRNTAAVAEEAQVRSEGMQNLKPEG
jgi:hypothetical protein